MSSMPLMYYELWRVGSWKEGDSSNCLHSFRKLVKALKATRRTIYTQSKQSLHHVNVNNLYYWSSQSNEKTSHLIFSPCLCFKNFEELKNAFFLKIIWMNSRRKSKVSEGKFVAKKFEVVFVNLVQLGNILIG